MVQDLNPQQLSCIEQVFCNRDVIFAWIQVTGWVVVLCEVASYVELFVFIER
jgi:hypothetical protein